jgi:hypothetical protein
LDSFCFTSSIILSLYPFHLLSPKRIMFQRSLQLFLSVSALLIVPSCAQFGVGNRKPKTTRFQELQEMAQQQQGGEDAGDATAKLQQLWANALDDPAAMDQMQQFGDQFGGAMEQMMKMSPEELQAEMEKALKMMTEGDIVDTILQQKEEVLKSLEASGTVSAEELEKYRTDPEYFELKMRESFDQMKDIFSNPEYVSKATEAMKNMQGLLSDPDSMADLAKTISGEWQSDEKIEEARLEFLRGDFNSLPAFKEAFETDEMQEILKDPVKWRETVKEGFQDLLTMGSGAGAAEDAKDEL